jgi:cytochrome c oxidase subunit 4
MVEHAQHSSEHHPAENVYYGVFALLMVLLAVTILVARFELGVFSFPAAAAIASVKALLIVLYFMHVRYSRPLTWLVAGAGFFWLAILFALTLADYWTRGWPSSVPLP